MSRTLRALVAVVLATVFLSSAAPAVDLEGTLSLLGKKGNKPARGVDARTAVIWWEPTVPVPVRPLTDGAEVSTRDKEFEPRILVVTAGTEVRFPNEDPILHNVFSVSGENSFDLGLYRTGPGESFTFQHPGLVRIFCNVHHSMVGYVLVLDTPYSTRPDREGHFRLEDLPAGEGTLVVWHERSAESLREPMSLPLEAPASLELRITKPRVPRHLNKAGRPYERSSDEY